MQMYDIIQKKKAGEALSSEEIRFFIDGYTAGLIPDYQASALCMAICFQGMDDREMTDLTLSMRDSGETADMSFFGGLSVDKHSTGGVGDKTSLIVGPITAALGCKVAKMSGRGLGHTGGTVDKLESIPGFSTSLSPEAFRKQVEEIGLAIVGQSGNFAPADKKLYALRDVTATVDSIPLIASSIMSKKLAAGADHIVLDVKCGSGAFMKTVDEAKLLASKMVAIGTGCGKGVSALITNMDRPLGRAIGNAMEVKEAYRVLNGQTEGLEDLKEVCLALSAEMVSLCFSLSREEASTRCERALSDGSAKAQFLRWISCQGGDIGVFGNEDSFCPARFSAVAAAPYDAYISHMDAESIGKAGVRLGAGRLRKEDEIDFSAGIFLLKKTGDYVRKGEPIAELFSSTVSDFSDAIEEFSDSLSYSIEKITPKPVIFDRVP